LAKAEAEEGQAESVAKSAASTGQRAAEAARKSERPTAGAKSGAEESTTERRTEASAETATTEPVREAQETASQTQPRPATETSDRQREEARAEGGDRPRTAIGAEAPSAAESTETQVATTARPESRLIRVAAVLNLTLNRSGLRSVRCDPAPAPLRRQRGLRRLDWRRRAGGRGRHLRCLLRVDRGGGGGEGVRRRWRAAGLFASFNFIYICYVFFYYFFYIG